MSKELFFEVWLATFKLLFKWTLIACSFVLFALVPLNWLMFNYETAEPVLVILVCVYSLFVCITLIALSIYHSNKEELEKDEKE